MSRPKKNSEHRLIIMDFSFPTGSSVNSGIPKDMYLGTPYTLHYPTVDDYVRLILHNGDGCLLYKVDLARSFRMIPVNPLDNLYRHGHRIWSAHWKYDMSARHGCYWLHHGAALRCQDTAVCGWLCLGRKKWRHGNGGLHKSPLCYLLSRYSRGIR